MGDKILELKMWMKILKEFSFSVGGDFDQPNALLNILKN
jgi:hypothetical protein